MLGLVPFNWTPNVWFGAVVCIPISQVVTCDSFLTSLILTQPIGFEAQMLLPTFCILIQLVGFVEQMLVPTFKILVHSLMD
jgi:hypothetical protein